MSAARIGGWWQLSLPPAGLQRLRGGAGALSPPGSKDAGTDALEQVAERPVSETARSCLSAQDVGSAAMAYGDRVG